MNDEQEKNALKQKLQALAAESPQKEVSYQDLFSPAFMQKYTDFASFSFFMQGLQIKDFNQIADLKKDHLNDFVKNNSHFTSWDEMQQAAVNEYMTKKKKKKRKRIISLPFNFV